MIAISILFCHKNIKDQNIFENVKGMWDYLCLVTVILHLSYSHLCKKQ